MTVVDYVPQRRIVFEKEEPFPIRFGFEVERHGDSTCVQYPVEMRPKGVFRVVLPVVGRRTIAGDLTRIARHLEAAQSPRS